MSTGERINGENKLPPHFRVEGMQVSAATAVHCSLLMESLMSDIQRCCSHGDRVKIKGFMKSLLSRRAIQIKWLPNMAFCKRYMVLFWSYAKAKIERQRERESCNREMRCFLCCTPESAIFSSTGFLFIHYSTTRASLSGSDAASSCQYPLVLFSCIWMVFQPAGMKSC